MNSSQTLEVIKSTVNSFLPGARVLLFGSRAKGSEHSESDYDLLVITAATFAPREKMAWESKIRKALVYSLDMPFDVIVHSHCEVEEKKNITGHIVYYGMKEAVAI